MTQLHDVEIPHVEIRFHRLEPLATVPEQMLVGFNLRAHCLTEIGRHNSVLIPPNTTRVVRTGWGISLPTTMILAAESLCVGICSHPSLLKRSIFAVNAPAVIDIQTELTVVLYNGGHESHYVLHEDNIAQLTIFQVLRPVTIVV